MLFIFEDNKSFTYNVKYFINANDKNYFQLIFDKHYNNIHLRTFKMGQFILIL
jgi:hypothetical protein